MLDKDSFFNTYPIMDAFNNSGLRHKMPTEK